MSATFGCARCWPDSAEGAWQARKELPQAVELIDESHFHVMLLACPDCAQRFLSVFTETIDGKDGEDPQYWTVVPVTEGEAADLAQRGASLNDAALSAVGRGRRALRRDFPTGSAPTTYWGTGMSVGPHD